MLELTELSPAAGENLEYDARYLELEDLLTAKANVSVVGDEELREQESGTDYRRAEKLCTELWQESRDLRLAAYYTVAATARYGLSGLRDGLGAVKYLVDELWNEFYPQLDPDDDNDPTERVNILSCLAPKADSFDDPVNFNQLVLGLKLFERGVFSCRDLMMVRGELAGGELDVNDFNAEALSQNPDQVRERLDLCGEINDLLSGIEQVMNEKMNGLNFISLETLQRKIKLLQDFYREYGSPDEKPAAAAGESVSEPAAVPAAAAPKAVSLSAISVSSRKEALMLVQKAEDYFLNNDSTSPAPYLLQRAIRMADMNFIDLLAEIDQSALERGKEQFGIRDQNDY